MEYYMDDKIIIKTFKSLKKAIEKQNEINNVIRILTYTPPSYSSMYSMIDSILEILEVYLEDSEKYDDSSVLLNIAKLESDEEILKAFKELM